MPKKMIRSNLIKTQSLLILQQLKFTISQTFSTVTKVKKTIESDINCAYRRKLDCKNPKSASKVFYTEMAIIRIKEELETKKITIPFEPSNSLSMVFFFGSFFKSLWKLA